MPYWHVFQQLQGFKDVVGDKLNSSLFLHSELRNVQGDFHDQGDAEWIVIRKPSKGHNDTPFWWPILGWPISRPGVGHPQGVFGVLSYY
jgi:hypothetical protein